MNIISRLHNHTQNLRNLYFSDVFIFKRLIDLLNVARFILLRQYICSRWHFAKWLLHIKGNFNYPFGHLNGPYQTGTDPRTALRLEACQYMVVVLYVRQTFSVSQELVGNRILRFLEADFFLMQISVCQKYIQLAFL